MVTVSCEIRAMRKFVIILVIASAVLVTALLTGVVTADPTTTWQTFERRLPGALQESGVRVLASRTEGGDQVALPLAVRIRNSLTPQSQANLVLGLPESVQHYTLESVQSRGRIDCLVRYSRGKVACIVVRYPFSARLEAVKLDGELRHIADGTVVRLNETTNS